MSKTAIVEEKVHKFDDKVNMGKRKEEIQGIIPALITPFDKSGEVNYNSLGQLVEYLIGEGADGFYVCGSTSECFLLSQKERKQVMQFVLEKVNGRIPIIAHIGDISTTQAIDYAKHAQSNGATAISSVAPFYYKFSADQITKYYTDVSDSVDLPLIVYHVPVLSGVGMTPEILLKLAKNTNMYGLKYTSYNLYELERIRRTLPDLNIYNGHDELYCNALPVGIQGAIGSTFNIMLKMYKRIYTAFMDGNNNLSSKIQHEVNEQIDVLIKHDIFASIKEVLTQRGIDCGGPRAPFTEIDKKQKEELKKVFNTPTHSNESLDTSQSI